ncbi:MAG: 30S ribosomal protein S2 [Deltaproteobacteria bacterium]|nr:30S ribosomal protein S2 [Deltaproteobacteria bacterium]
MSETTVDPSAASATADTPTAPAAAGTAAGGEAVSETAQELAKTEVSIKTLLESGAHFGHQTRRWNPRMRGFIFGERNGTHIIDLDQTYPMFREALDFIRETAAEGGRVLFVGTKRQAAPSIMTQAQRAGQFYVNNRWLGGMLTNWKTVKKSIDRFKSFLEIQADPEKEAELSKKEMARVNRACDKYAKSLDGMKTMSKLPDALFVIDVAKEAIAVSEANRLSIPVIAIVDSNCNPDGIDFVVPGNDDAIRSVELYCAAVADACIDGEAIHQERLKSQPKPTQEDARPSGPSTGRRVVEIKQPPRRSRGGGGEGSGRTRSSGGWSDKKKPGEGADKPAEAGAAAPEKPAAAAAKKPAEAPKAVAEKPAEPSAAEPSAAEPSAAEAPATAPPAAEAPAAETPSEDEKS